MMMQNLCPVTDVFSSGSQASGGSRYPIPGVCSSPDLRGHMTLSKSAFDGPLEKNSAELCRTVDTIHERRIWKILDKANSLVRVKSHQFWDRICSLLQIGQSQVTIVRFSLDPETQTMVNTNTGKHSRPQKVIEVGVLAEVPNRVT